MKTLLVLRHAKSSWKDGNLTDHERPLNHRGKHDAPGVGELLLDQKLTPQRILCSTARRARNTAELVMDACEYAGELTLLSELYDAPADNYLQAIKQLNDDDDIVMIVGHNPAIEELVQLLTGEYQPMSTAALAHIQFSAAHWKDVGLRKGELAAVWRPREAHDS